MKETRGAEGQVNILVVTCTCHHHCQEASTLSGRHGEGAPGSCVSGPRLDPPPTCLCF